MYVTKSFLRNECTRVSQHAKQLFIHQDYDSYFNDDDDSDDEDD